MVWMQLKIERAVYRKQREVEEVVNVSMAICDGADVNLDRPDRPFVCLLILMTVLGEAEK